MTSHAWRSSVLFILLLAAPALAGSVSAQTRRSGETGVTVFTNPNFGGERATFRSDTPDLRQFSLNDKISSIEIPAGETWEICQDINYGNRCQVLSGSVSDLRQMGWNDSISSLRLVRGGFQARRSGRGFPSNATQELIVFDRPGYKGASRSVTSQTSNLGLGGRGGSVEVQGGGTWELCDRTGRCATVSQDVPDLSRLGLKGQVTSVRPLSNQAYGRGNGRGYERGR